MFCCCGYVIIISSSSNNNALLLLLLLLLLLCCVIPVMGPARVVALEVCVITVSNIVTAAAATTVSLRVSESVILVLFKAPHPFS